MKHSICIIPSRTGGHDWMVISDRGVIADKGHADESLAANKDAWRACGAADALARETADAPQPATDDMRSQLLDAPASLDYGVPGRPGFWLGASSLTPSLRSAS